MIVIASEHIEITADRDLSRARRVVAVNATRLKYGTLNQTKLVTAASELARNMLVYGGGGTMRVEEIRHHGRIGLRVTFEDTGPGISNQNDALQDGFSSGQGLGLGLGGARRLVDEFHLETEKDKGTTVSILNWLR